MNKVGARAALGSYRHVKVCFWCEAISTYNPDEDGDLEGFVDI